MVGAVEKKKSVTTCTDFLVRMKTRKMYTLFTKENAACNFCEKAKQLLTERRLEFREAAFSSLADLQRHVGEFVDPELVRSFPLIIDPARRVHFGYEQLRDALDEPVLASPLRLSVFPIEHPDLYQLYKQHVAGFWVSDEISTDQYSDFESLSTAERDFIKNILAFFSQSDGIVNENIMRNFLNEVQFQESKLFYSIQSFMESEHNVTYSVLLDNLVRDDEEKNRCFNAVRDISAVKKKAEWAEKWMCPSRRFVERLVAFACVEGILFSGSFAAIFWLKQKYPDILHGLYQANAFISRDENLHYEHAIALYRKLKNPLQEQIVHEIIREAVDNEIEFIVDSISCEMIGMNNILMSRYIEYVANSMCTDLGYAPIYEVTKCPFQFMTSLGMNSKTNFFETRPTEYQKSGNMIDDNSDEEDF